MSAQRVRTLFQICEGALQIGDWTTARECAQQLMLSKVSRSDEIIALIAESFVEYELGNMEDALAVMTRVIILARTELNAVGAISNALLDVYLVVSRLASISDIAGRWAYNIVSSFGFDPRESTLSGAGGRERQEITKMGMTGTVLFREKRYAESRLPLQLAFNYMRDLGMNFLALPFATALAVVTHADEYIQFVQKQASDYPKGIAARYLSELSLSLANSMPGAVPD